MLTPNGRLFAEGEYRVPHDVFEKALTAFLKDPTGHSREVHEAWQDVRYFQESRGLEELTQKNAGWYQGPAPSEAPGTASPLRSAAKLKERVAEAAEMYVSFTSSIVPVKGMLPSIVWFPGQRIVPELSPEALEQRDKNAWVERSVSRTRSWTVVALGLDEGLTSNQLASAYVADEIGISRHMQDAAMHAIFAHVLHEYAVGHYGDRSGLKYYLDSAGGPLLEVDSKVHEDVAAMQDASIRDLAIAVRANDRALANSPELS